jgi:cytoskeleton protein RodZ
MSDPATIGTAGLRASTAGGMLREARLARGVHIAALAATIKVVPRKLELLESDQFDQLPDATFTRALAQAVCRALKIDPAPILALMPPAKGHRLEQVASGLNTPFHERADRQVTPEWAIVTRPVLWIAGLLLLAAVVVYVLPSDWLPRGLGSSAPVAPPPAPLATTPPPLEPVAASAVAPTIAAEPPQASASTSSAAAATTAVAPSADSTSVAAAPSAGDTPAVLQVRTKAPSWIQVVAGGGQVLISRVVQPGENVALDGALPMQLTIGNAVATEVTLRGHPVELASHTRDNVARLEVQ